MGMFKNNKYNLAAFWLYMCYFVQSMQAVFISLNTQFFADRWGTDVAGALDVVTWIGLGKFVVIFFSGTLSDKFGRRLVSLVGIIGYIILFGMMLFAQDLVFAKVLAFIGGGAASCFDGSIYAAVMEIYPNDKSTASILNKVFIAASGIIYPIFCGVVVEHGWNPLFVLALPLLLSVIVLFGLSASRLPDDDIRIQEKVSRHEAVRILESRQSTASVSVKKVGKTNFAMEGTLLLLYSFCIYLVFYLFQQVVPLYAANVAGMDAIASRAVSSYFQAGSLAGVILSAVIMARGVRDMQLTIWYTLASGIFAVLVFVIPTPIIMNIGSFFIGYFSAGGALQMGNAILNQFFDKNKGRNSSFYLSVVGLGSVIVPKVASIMLKADMLKTIMIIVAVAAFVAFAAAVIVSGRYKQVFGVSAFDRELK